MSDVSNKDNFVSNKETIQSIKPEKPPALLSLQIYSLHLGLLSLNVFFSKLTPLKRTLRLI